VVRLIVLSLKRSMNKSQVCLIVNPISGTESKKNIPEFVASAFDQKEIDLEIRITGYAGHATEIAKEAVEKKYKSIIAAGGDGTVNEIARTLVDTETVLGILPLGSGNGLARDLGIPIDNEKAMDIILQENVRKIDYGVVNDHIFFCTCGFGFDAFVSDKFSYESRRGPLGYVRNVIESVVDFKAEEYIITYDGGELKEKAFILTCANASQYGNEAHIAPGASLDDGKMNVSILKPLNALEIPQTTIQLFTKNIDKNSKMTTLMTEKLHVKREKSGVIHVDGDPVETGKEIDVHIVHSGLRVYAQNEDNHPHHRNKIELEGIFGALTRWFN
jgi:diacylglycerol kinase (ATP)